MVLSAWLQVTLFNWYVYNLLWRYLIAAYLCWAGWLEVHGIIVSVKVGFLKLDICSRMLYPVLCTEMSKQFIVLFDSVSAVKCRLGCMELIFVRMDCVLEGAESKMRRMSST